MFETAPNRTPVDFDPGRHLPPDFPDLLRRLHETFTPRRRILLERRAMVRAAARQGRLPDYKPPGPATRGDWVIPAADGGEPPAGLPVVVPADDPIRAIAALNGPEAVAGGDVLLDFEATMADLWPNLTWGLDTALGALHGVLTHYDSARELTIGIAAGRQSLWIRPRGLERDQCGLFGDEALPAALFDVALIATEVELDDLRFPLRFSLPGPESAAEGAWWRDLFEALAAERGWPAGTLRCRITLESHPLAFELEEFLAALRDHVVAVDLDPTDYTASLGELTLPDRAWVLPDDGTIPAGAPFLSRVEELANAVAARRGIAAVTGEAAVPAPGQDADDRYPDLRPRPTGIGRISHAGTVAAVQALLAHETAHAGGRGVAEVAGHRIDRAAARLAFVRLAQRLRHAETLVGLDELGRPFKPTADRLDELFREQIRAADPAKADGSISVRAESWLNRLKAAVSA